ncbi:UNVERIFIED_CONTAM: hypothetical protein RMT77_005089 [Armadillidium vulgare]
MSLPALLLTTAKMYLILSIFCLQIFVSSSSEIDCDKDCKGYIDPNYKPQECDEKCKDRNETEAKEDFKDLLVEIRTMKIMIVVLLTVIILLALFLPCIILKKFKISQIFTKFYGRMKKDSEKPKLTKASSTEEKYFRCLAHSEILEETKRENNSANLRERDLTKIKATSDDCASKGNRYRKPSESSCPEDIQSERNAYDNLALSTSSINFQSRTSSPTLNDTVELSMNPLNTTMTTVPMDLESDTNTRI